MARARSGGTAKRSAVRIKRAYEPREDGEGHRVLVDRLWPRGVRKEELAPDEWVRELSPSDDLRKWFGHEPSRWPEFQRRYRRELSSGPGREALERLVEQARGGPLTLLYGARDEEHNNAVVLAALIDERLARGAKPAAKRAAAARGATPSARGVRRTVRKERATAPRARPR